MRSTFFLVMLFWLQGCSHFKLDSAEMTKEECEKAKECFATGMLEMSSDGHAFIGKLTLEDGSCINVSLPDRNSKSLLGKPATLYKAHGLVFPYPTSEDILGIEVNGREVGFGLCGSFYVFVKSII